MEVAPFTVDVSYGQLAVFRSGLEDPFNNWTDQHVAQGFAWREGSVSFAALLHSGPHSTTVTAPDDPPSVDSEAVRAIEVPFDIPSDGAIEVAIIADSASLTLPSGRYCLRCELFAPRSDTAPVRLIFVQDGQPEFRGLVAGGLSVGGSLLTTAEPAR